MSSLDNALTLLVNGPELASHCAVRWSVASNVPTRGREAERSARSPARPARGLSGVEGAEPLVSLRVIPGVCWLDALSLRQASGNAVSTAE